MTVLQSGTCCDVRIVVVSVTSGQNVAFTVITMTFGRTSFWKFTGSPPGITLLEFAQKAVL